MTTRKITVVLLFKVLHCLGRQRVVQLHNHFHLTSTPHCNNAKRHLALERV